MGKFYQCIQSYGPSFMTKFCSALYLENLLTNIFAKLNLRGGVSWDEYLVFTEHFFSCLDSLIEPTQKTNNLHMRKQRHRSASR